MVRDGDVFDTVKDWQFYVVGTANSMLRGTFTMKIWIEQNMEPQTKTKDKPHDYVPPPPEPEPEPVIVEEPDNGGETD